MGIRISSYRPPRVRELYGTVFRKTVFLREFSHRVATACEILEAVLDCEKHGVFELCSIAFKCVFGTRRCSFESCRARLQMHELGLPGCRFTEKPRGGGCVYFADTTRRQRLLILPIRVAATNCGNLY